LLALLLYRSLPVSLLKKITHPYPFRFLLSCRSALQLPRLGRESVLSFVVLRPICRRSLAPRHARLSPPPVMCAACFLLPHALVLAPPVAHAARPTDPSLVPVVVVLALRHSSPAPTPRHPELTDTGAALPLCCKYVFQLF
jgi:hypothetical protein